MNALDGLLVIDKPSGWTSHDIVAFVRKRAGTRKVGHAGTLDPMATGVLLLGLGRVTRLLGYLAATDKVYAATIRLGQQTATDDAEGEVEGAESTIEVMVEDVESAIPAFVGDIEQVPSKVSAIKVDGKRAYARVRAGETVDLAPRPVHVRSIDLLGHRRPTRDLFDVDVEVICSSGTYIRAIARDLGTTLGVGGHLTRLRRLRVGTFTLAQAHTPAALEHEVELVPLADVLRATFSPLVVDEPAAASVRHGRPVPYLGEQGLRGVFDSSGNPLALMEPREGQLRVVVGFTG